MVSSKAKGDLIEHLGENIPGTIAPLKLRYLHGRLGLYGQGVGALLGAISIFFIKYA